MSHSSQPMHYVQSKCAAADKTWTHGSMNRLDAHKKRSREFYAHHVNSHANSKYSTSRRHKTC